jgi:hypothetical protein
MHFRQLFLPFALLAVSLTAVVALSAGWPAHSSAHPQVSSSTSRQPVIVELFTSEGCSSCPPADALLKELSEDQSIDGAEIIALEEHVDYWNHLGWADPFSSPDFSRRQEDYTTTLPDGGVYTPQMIVDGRAQFVGSNSRDAREQIRSAASHPKPRLLLTPIAASNSHSRSFELRLDPANPLPGSPHPELWLAITEADLRSNVTAGENSGEALQHAPVVRLLRKVQTVQAPLAAPLRVDFDLRNNWNPSHLTAVVFLADSRSRQVLAAGRFPLAP